MKPNPLTAYHGKFSCIESKLKEYPIIGFDTEDNSKGVPVLFAFYGDFPGEKFVTKYWQKALDFIYGIENPSIFVAHNLEYDIANLFKQDDYLMIDEMIYASKLLRVSLYGTEHFFINSSCFFQGSLKKLAKFVGLEKLEGDPFSKKYILQDAKIPYVFIKKFQKKLVNDLEVNLGISIGQMTMQTYRRSYMSSKVQKTYNSPNCLKAYYGGRVEIFYKGFINDVTVCDINSSYPNVMRNYYYPDSSNIEPSSIDTHEYGIGHFKVMVPEDNFLPVLPYKSPEGRLFFPTGIFSGWWTYAEMRYAIENGTIILNEFAGEGTNNGCRPFEKFIDNFYGLRLDCKMILEREADNQDAIFDDLFYKLWQNNLYGKWCQHKANSTMTRDKWSDFKLSKLREHPEFKESKIGPFYNYTVPRDTPPKTANFIWGIYVTSYARIELHKGLKKIHDSGGTVLYCDTDSVMFTGIKKNPLPISKQLGDWDLEHYDLGVFRQAKGYLLCNKKGDQYMIRKTFYNGKSKSHYYGPVSSFKNISYDIIKCACKGVPTHMAYDFIVDGMATTMKPLRMKEALIRMNAEVNQGNDEFLKDIGENVWREVHKEMKSVYIKRKGVKGVTYPVNVDEIKELEAGSLHKGHSSIKKQLSKADIKIKRKTYKNPFENTVIPDGYFNYRRAGKNKASIYISQKIFFFKKEQCLELAKGDNWFAGDVLQIRKNKKGKSFYYILIDRFKGKKVPVKFWGAIWINFFKQFGVEENFLNKYLVISLGNNYNINGSPNFKIKILPQKIQGDFESENFNDDDELTETEIRNLKALDWSTIKCPK